MNKLLASTLISIGLSTVALPVLAQPSNPPSARTVPGAPEAQSRENMRRPNDRRPVRDPQAMTEARLAYVKTALKITAAQQPQWDAFANIVRKQATERTNQMQAWRAQRGQSAQGQRPTAIARLELQQQWLTHAAANLNERLTAQRPLYAALSPDQQKVADELLVPNRHGNFRHREMRRRA